MNFNELLDTLQKLKSGYKINQMSIANVLGLSRQTMSKRFQIGTEVTVSELQELENFYGVSLYKESTHNTFERQNDITVNEKSSQFGKRLSLIQEKHNFLDREMAKLLKISEDEYIDLVCGDKEPDLQILNCIKQNFKVSIDYLLYGD
ncbi:MAG: hypothetical protein KHX03_09745 [Clostridium sp.]|nr:hypothetical protein [Clostridium sp.]